MMSRAFALSAAAVLAGSILFAFAAGAPQTGKDTPVHLSLPDPAGMEARRHIFISGHSLTDRPVPYFLSEIADASGLPIVWNRQHIGGSSIRSRSFGDDAARPWSGFSAGTDPEGRPIDVLAELRAPEVPEAGPYDILLITEQHRLLDTLLWQDTVTHLGAYQDRFVAANPQGQTFFFTPWLDVSDKSDLADWIAYERAAWPVWQCTVARVNDRIAAEGRPDRIFMIPVSLALADLMAHLRDDPALPGFAFADDRQAADAIFSDDVHLTPVGNYFVAALTFHAIYGRLPGPGAPSPIPAGQAETLRQFAAAFMDRYRETTPTFDSAACASGPGLPFILHYTGYVERTYTRAERGYLRSRIQQVRDTLRFAFRL
ncbi:hypothetical protein NOF55_16605 [Rhizobiaceae bacterium BDR2-2]|uniref:SGNH/GDSL hydrolase family protein n=1 Tax=Ectorhizobium quercum TaxID=2965071 RepID=A0AAE3SVV4_9HYPH|nr:hypothetical protein [Ectorhizobium quercum]MCX8996226.1 hypothetical protein [Ectorhizobium quercum]MCX8998735.1 hypothetical protein [Ectorhizobium quercum]